jgi:hypothetical protein
LKWNAFLKGPDFSKSLHGVAGMSENNPLQKIELPLEQTFKGGLDQMATVGRKMGLNMGHLDGRAHETKGKSAGSVDEFLGNMGTEKPDRNTVLGERRGDFSISLRSDRFEFF